MNKKIAFIVSHTTNSHQWEWFIEVLRNHVSVVFILLGNECSLSIKLREISNKVYVINYESGIIGLSIALIKIIKILRVEKVNIIQTEMPHGNLLGILAGRVLCINKIIMTASNVTWYMDFNSKKQYLIDIFSYFFSTHIITQTELSAQWISKKFNVNSSKITTIYHGFKLTDYLNIREEEVTQLRNKYKISKDDYVLGMIARLEYWKGHEYAIKAVSEIVNEFSNVKLLIFGLGPDKNKILKLIQDLKLENNVFLCGFEEKIIPLYKVFNLQIHVPIDEYCETFGLTIVDGMLTRTPQILTRSGIAYNIVKHMHNCVLVPFKDEKAIADAIKLLIKNPDLSSKISYNAFVDAKNLFSLDEKIKKHLELYQL